MKLTYLLVLALVLAACGGAAADTGQGVASLDESAGTTTTTVALTDEEAAIAFTECMREQGIDMEDPTVDSEGNVIPGRPTNLPDPGEGQDGRVTFGEDMRNAFAECGDLLQGTNFGFTRVDRTQLQDQLIELAACLRDQGLDVADPDLSQLEPGSGDGEVRQGGGPLGLDFQDPAVQEALDACGEFVPNFGQRIGPGGPGQAPPAAND